MGLDFSVLDTLQKTDAQEATGVDILTLDRETPSYTEKTLRGVYKGLTEDMAKKPPVKQAKTSFKVINEDVLESVRALQAEVLKAVKEGKPDQILLLKAMEAIATLTGEEEYFKKIKNSIFAIYGDGLEKSIPLEWLLRDTRKEREALIEALKRKDLPPDSRKEIEEAIVFHEAWEKDIEDKLEEKGEPRLFTNEEGV